jgi:probable O-glycosylation ligase (exosortase A-associated)
MTGFQDRVYGPPGSQIGGNNEFAVATAMAIPLLVLWLREAQDRVLRGMIMGAVAVCYASALSSWSRGGVLSLSVMTLLVLWHTRSKLLALPLLALGGVLMAELLPEKWFGRMHSISEFAGDQSAMGRIEAWQAAWVFVREHPVAGAGFEGWRLITWPESGDGGAIDWHSAYVEILVEHGAVGLVLWGLLLTWTLIGLTRLAWRGRCLMQPWLTSYSNMLRASLAAYLVGAVTLGITYWELLYLLIGAAILLGRLAQEPGSSRALDERPHASG